MFSRQTQALMEAAVDAIIVIDHRGTMLAANDSTCQVFGFRVDELLGENVKMLMPESDRAHHDEHLARHIATGVARIIGIGREVIAQRKDGTLFPARLSVGRIPDADPAQFVGLVRDTTREHEATAALKLERDRASAYLELHDSILLTLDAERRISEVNTRGSELLGAPLPEIVGRDWLDFIHGPIARERALLMLASALANGSSREREFDALVSGEPRRFYWRCIARRAADGTPAGWLCSGADVTDRARRQEAALIAQDRLTRVAHLATLGEMTSGVAHLLNQPLTAITSYARACERFLAMPEPDLAEVKGAVHEIAVEGLRAGEIIRQLRQMVRPNAPHERTRMDINAHIEELRPLLLADAREHETTLRIALSPALPRVLANGEQLQQVVLNLARNAFEALSDTSVGSRDVELSTAPTPEGDAEIRISDNGPGISPLVSERLFDAFATTKSSGTGLGLAISRTIAQAHGGTIGTRPVEPHGVCFYVRLPVAEEV